MPTRPDLLTSPILLDDTSSMIDLERMEWDENSAVRRLLEEYLHRQDATRLRQAEFDGWLPRIHELAGIEAEEMAALHGKLIALGFLKFQLVNRTAGMHYQVDASGKEALARSTITSDDADEPNVDTPDDQDHRLSAA